MNIAIQGWGLKPQLLDDFFAETFTDFFASVVWEWALSAVESEDSMRAFTIPNYFYTLSSQPPLELAVFHTLLRSSQSHYYETYLFYRLAKNETKMIYFKSGTGEGF